MSTSTFERIQSIMDTAKPNERGIYFKPEEEGQYTLEITKALYKERGDSDVEGYIVETKVVESSNPLVPVGVPRTLTFWVKPNSGWQDRWYSFLQAVFPGPPPPVRDLSVAIIDPEEGDKRQIPRNLMVGRRVNAFGFKKETANKKILILELKYQPARSS